MKINAFVLRGRKIFFLVFSASGMNASSVAWGILPFKSRTASAVFKNLWYVMNYSAGYVESHFITDRLTAALCIRLRLYVHVYDTLVIGVITPKRACI